MYSKIKLFIIDDRDTIREMIKLFLSKHSDIEIIGEAASGDEAISKLSFLNPDVILTDVSMPEMDGFDFVAWLKKVKPGPRILVMSISDNEYQVLKMCKLGVGGYFVKDEGMQKMYEAIKTISGGWYYLSDNIHYILFSKELFVRNYLLPSIADHRRNARKVAV